MVSGNGAQAPTPILLSPPGFSSCSSLTVCSLQWIQICFPCPSTLKPYSSSVLVFLFPLAASANPGLSGTTCVLPWILLLTFIGFLS